MYQVVARVFPLFISIFLVMIGGGAHDGLAAYLGAREGMLPAQMTMIMSGYFLGIILGAYFAPRFLARVGFLSGLSFFITIIVLAYLAFVGLTHFLVWFLARVALGAGFCGVYVAIEGQLNAQVDSKNRGTLFGVYFFVRQAAIFLSSWIMISFGEKPAVLFVLLSILTLLSLLPVFFGKYKRTDFKNVKPLRLVELVAVSPTGVFTVLMLGGILALRYVVFPIYVEAKGYTIAQLALLLLVMNASTLLTQFPFGWISDKMDRRALMIIMSTGTALCLFVGSFYDHTYTGLVLMACFLGATSLALYSIAMSYISDQVEPEKMPSVSAATLFLYGIGATVTPLFMGVLFKHIGIAIFWPVMVLFFALIAVFGIYRQYKDKGPKMPLHSFLPYSPVALRPISEEEGPLIENKEED